jgi:ATP-dependent RNA helicase DDX3X
MCVAQTGSGKTCGFLLPVMARLLKDGSGSVRFGPNQPASPSAVVMAPTRELAVQIHEEARRLSFLTRLRSCVVYGGAAAGGQLRDLAAGVDICVATPGRLQDFVDRGVISLAGSRVLVLDEADRMLDMGFEPQIRKLIDKRDMPTRAQGRQTLMFSATFAPEVQRLARDFLREYTYVTVGRVGSTVSAITQNLVWCAQNDKRAKLGLLRVALEDAPPPARTLRLRPEDCAEGVPAGEADAHGGEEGHGGVGAVLGHACGICGCAPSGPKVREGRQGYGDGPLRQCGVVGDPLRGLRGRRGGTFGPRGPGPPPVGCVL